MNDVILELSAVEDKIIDNKKMYSFEIHKRMSEMLKIDKREELRVSNIFGEFFNESIKLEKGEKYKIRVITKTQEIFLKLQDQLFQLAINKENLVIGDGIFQLVGIITKNDTWCGEYDFDKEMKALDVGTLSFYEKVNLKIEKIEEQKAKLLEKKDVLEFQFNEINDLDLKINEDGELEEEYKILFNSGKISEKLEESSQWLKEGDFSILSALGKVRKNLEQLSDLSEIYGELSEKVESIVYEVEEVSYSIDNFIGDVEEVNDTKLEKVVKRIDKINKLKFLHPLHNFSRFLEAMSNECTNTSTLVQSFDPHFLLVRDF